MLLQVRWRNEAASEELLWSGQGFLFDLTECVCLYIYKKQLAEKRLGKRKRECLQL